MRSQDNTEILLEGIYTYLSKANYADLAKSLSECPNTSKLELRLSVEATIKK